MRNPSLLLLALVALLLPGASALAGPADKLPTLAKVQSLFPDVTERQVTTGADLQLMSDCLTFSDAAHPKKSVSGEYPEPPPIGPGGGAPNARVDVYFFKNEKKARKALKLVTGYVANCAGPHSAGTTTNTVTALADPDLADKSLAYQWGSTVVVPPNNLVIPTNGVHVVVQRDDRLVDAYYLNHSTPAPVGTVTKLAKAALKSSA